MHWVRSYEILIWSDDGVPLLPQTMSISYTSHRNLNIQNSQFLALFYMKLSEILHAGRKFIPESKYVPKFIKFIKVLGEVIK